MVRQMPPGIYWIGDPKFALDENCYHEVYHEIKGSGKYEFVIDACRVAIFDIGRRGEFNGQLRTVFSIESGLIAAIPLKVIQWRPSLTKGEECNFSKPFDSSFELPDVRFGPIHIELS